MTERTAIEWCDSTFNPWIGCTKISPACDHCYAEAQMRTRLGRVEWGDGKPRSRTSAAYWRHPLQWNKRADTFRQCGACGWRGDIIVRAEPIPMPCPECGAVDHRPARRRVFCASLADVFDNEADPEWRADLFELIAATPNLDWLLLTKRIGNVAAMVAEAFDAVKRRFWIGQEYMRLAHRDVTSPEWTDPALPPNVWLGATVVNQQEADRDIPKLLAVRAAKRFLSIEPMLGPVQLWPCWLRIGCGFGGDHDPARTHCFPCGAGKGYDSKRCAWPSQRIDWIICGGESGPHARPMHPDWVRSMRDQCAAAGVPFLFKQWGEWAPYRLQRVAGRQVDGREHLEWPK